MKTYACFLRYSPRDDPFLYLIVVKMVGWKFEHLEVEGHKRS